MTDSGVFRERACHHLPCVHVYTHTHTHTRVRMHALAGSRSFQPSVFQRANPPLPHLSNWKVHFLPDRQEFLAPALPTLFHSPFPFSLVTDTEHSGQYLRRLLSVKCWGTQVPLMQSPDLRSTIKSHLRQWISLSTALENLFTPFWSHGLGFKKLVGPRSLHVNSGTSGCPWPGLR